MKLPEDVRRSLAVRWKHQHRDWLVWEEQLDAHAWPLAIALGLPTETNALRQPSGLAAWTKAWRDWQGPGRIEWTERRWHTLGIQRLPERLLLESPVEVATLLGQSERWQRARARRSQFVDRWPVLRTVLLRHFDMLADYTDADFFRLSSLLEWLSKHPASNLYPRQLPVPGLDSKWLEQRTALVSSLLTALRGEDADAGGQDFYARCGLKAPPVLLRLRVLDQALRQRFGGLCDISAPIEELMRLDLPAKRVLVVENLQSALALPDLLGAVVFTALGKSVSLLASLPWVRATQVHYWGDIDTHGLHILHHARTHLPEVRSILMDESTLLSHQVLWSEEPTQYGAEDLDMLDAAERWLYRDLKRHRWGYNVRLEQERIDWNAVIRAL